jgi:hypothetical protein
MIVIGGGSSSIGLFLKQSDEYILVLQIHEHENFQTPRMQDCCERGDSWRTPLGGGRELVDGEVGRGDEVCLLGGPACPAAGNGVGEEG